MGAPSPQEIEAARAELERITVEERCRLYTPNGRIEQILREIAEFPVRDGRTRVVLIRAGNSAGKTALSVNLAEYMSLGVPNPWLDPVPCLAQFKKPNRGRMLTTANAAANTYPDEFKKWFPRGRVTKSKRGRLFDAFFEWDNGSVFDIFTFDQDPEAGESITLDWAVVDEPMSRKHWTALKARFRFGGIIFLVLTALADAGWYHDELETPERLGDDVFAFQMSTEDNCIEHGIRGVIPHAALESMWADMDEAEIEARREGSYLHLTGRIYGGFRAGEFMDSTGKIVGHEPKRLPAYHADCWKKGLFTLKQVVDPHDRKPFAVGWYATFPNQQTFTVAEWPDSTMPPFHKIKRWNWGIEAYAKMFAATEKALGRVADERVMDPNFGRAPKIGTAGNTTTAQEFAKLGFHYVFTDDDIAQGHLKVKTLLGDPGAGVTPHLLNLAHCKNHTFGATHYGYHENRDDSKGLSEVPELQHKDFMDLWRYGAMHGFRYVKRDAAPLDFYTPTVRGNGYRS